MEIAREAGRLMLNRQARGVLFAAIGYAMQREGVSFALLAKRAGKDPEILTEMLTQGLVVTLTDLSDVCHACGCRVRLVLEPLEAERPSADQHAFEDVILPAAADVAEHVPVAP